MKVFTQCSKALRRVFPTRPALGLALAVAILLECGAVVYAGITRIYQSAGPVEGSWSLTDVDPIEGVCYYTRSDDFCSVGYGDGHTCMETTDAHPKYGTKPLTVNGCTGFMSTDAFPRGPHATDVSP